MLLLVLLLGAVLSGAWLAGELVAAWRRSEVVLLSPGLRAAIEAVPATKEAA